MDNDNPIISIIALFISLIPLIAWLMFSADPLGASSLLMQNGYKNIQIHGISFWGCGHHDFHATKFTATNPYGYKISGIVCKGLFFKSSTIRFT